MIDTIEAGAGSYPEPPEPKEKLYTVNCNCTCNVDISIYAKNAEEAEQLIMQGEISDYNILRLDIEEVADITEE